MSTFSLMDLNPLKFVNYSLLHCPHFNARGHNMYFGFLLFLYRDEDTKAPESFIRRRFTSPKSGIISSFLEDCLSVDSDDKKPVVSLRHVYFPSIYDILPQTSLVPHSHGPRKPLAFCLIL